MSRIKKNIITLITALLLSLLLSAALIIILNKFLLNKNKNLLIEPASNSLNNISFIKNSAARLMHTNINDIVIGNGLICDPFLDKNNCLLAHSLEIILKTSLQKSQCLYVVRKLDEYQLPKELALIPFLESQYNPYAISAKGAAGLWQLMPNTAKDYGLSDHERFNLVASTQAALLLLKELHRQFGSWELAIAAYNAGSKRVQMALSEKPLAKNIHELSLPIETKKYLSSFEKMKLFFH